ncbi:MAG: DUF5667 domain-containing protein [Candidatus Woykebacteria bacterium]
MNDTEFIEKLRKIAKIEHTGAQKEILWGRLYQYLKTTKVGGGLWYFSFRITYLVALVLVVLAASTGISFASQSSLPGEPLYSVKRFSEEARVFVIFGEKAKKKERIKLTTERVGEVQELISKDPEKAEGLLSEYEAQMENYKKEFAEDPELSESLNSTIMVNKDVFVKVVETAPDQIKIRIRVLIDEPEGQDTTESGGEVEGQQTTKKKPEVKSTEILDEPSSTETNR